MAVFLIFFLFHGPLALHGSKAILIVVFAIALGSRRILFYVFARGRIRRRSIGALGWSSTGAAICRLGFLADLLEVLTV